MATKWTKEQALAIDSRGQDILVAAAAGSGKTAVLVERIIKMISNPDEGRNIDELLVVTFTKAAASEMRQRVTASLEASLSQLRAEEADLPYGETLAPAKGDLLAQLERQLVLINRAQITTLHSFCTEIIRSFYYLIDIDPKVRVAEETETSILRQEALDRVLEDYYGLREMAEGERKIFFDLVDAYGSDRDDLPLQKMVMDLDIFAQSHPEPHEWLASLTEAYDLSEISTLDELDWIRDFKPQIKGKVQALLAKLDEAASLANLPYGPDNYASFLQAEGDMLADVVRAADGTWDEISQAINRVSFAPLRVRATNEVNPEVRERAKGLRDLVKAGIAEIQAKYFNVDSRLYLADMREMEPMIAGLVSLVIDFRTAYQDLKKDKGLVDFTDLEHFALDILRAQRAEVYEARDYYQNRFREILVDEYQDTNLVQEAIIQALKSEDNHIFMVGDVKQSIYRFRLAEPSLFMQKYSDFASPGQGQAGMKIDLAKNFRSRAPILHATNFIFRQLMDESLGEISYDDEAALVPGAGDYEPNPATDQVEVILVDQDNLAEPDLLVKYNISGEITGKTEAKTDKVVGGNIAGQDQAAGRIPEAGGQDQAAGKTGGGNSSEEDAGEDSPEDLNKAQLEGRLIAREIQKLIGQAGEASFQVYDKDLAKLGKKSRPIRYRDIVILYRSGAGYSDAILEELKEAGIPAYADVKTGYFQRVEIKIMMALLKIIDNPYQDIELAAVLRSPIVGLSSDELAQIRLVQPHGEYYQALQKLLGRGPWDLERRVDKVKINEESLAKLVNFYDNLQAWRDQARQGSLSELIWQLYRDTAYYDFVGGLDSGNQRQANLRALYDRARAYEQTSYRGLFRFLRFIENIQDRGQDLATARALSEQEDVVRLMTIHSSKGLEFPVVFVAGLSKNFNKQDLQGKYLLHKNMGLAASYINVQRRHEYPLLIKEIMKEKIGGEQLAEEMRVLYVAMTRAREKLYLLASLKKIDKEIEKWREEVTGQGQVLSDLWRTKSKGFIDWLGPAILGHRDLNIQAENLAYDPSGWRLKIVRAEEISQNEEGATDIDADKLAKLAGRQVIESKVPGPLGSDDPGQTTNNILEAEKDGQAKRYGHEELVRLIDDRLSWTYPHAEAIRLASEQSVSSLKAKSEQTKEEKFWSTIKSKPKFMGQDKITANKYGSLVHLLLEHIDLGQAVDQTNLADLVQRLIANEFMTDQQGQAIDLGPIVAFYQSELGQRIIAAYQGQAKEARGSSEGGSRPIAVDGSHVQGPMVEREMAFILGLPAKEIITGSQLEEKILIQGVIDMIFRDERGLVLVDYKTDRTKGLSDQELVDRYQLQLDLYATAIKSIWQEEITETYLCFLDGPRIIKLPVKP